MKIKQAFLATIFFFLASVAHAVTIGHFGSTSDANANAAIAGAGHTSSNLTGLTAGDLAGVDILWITNSDNGANPAQMTANVAAISSFVSAGGALIYQDRYVTGAGSVLPGSAGITFNRDFTDDAALDFVDLSSPLANGLDNTSLDGGSSSSHGYADLASLPADVLTILTRTDTSQIVDFMYGFGAGLVYYSTIPMDYYLNGSGPANVQANMEIYAQNVLGFVANEINTGASVPSPAPLALMGLGLLGIRLSQRRK